MSKSRSNHGPAHEVEQALLGACLFAPDRFPEVARTLKPDDFGTNGHSLIYGAMGSLFDRGQAVDLVSLSAELNGKGAETGGSAYLSQLLSETGTAMNLTSHAEIILRQSVRRRFVRESQNFVARLKESADPAEVAEQFQGKLSELSARLKGQNKFSLRELGPNPVRRFLREHPPEPAYLFEGILTRGTVAALSGPGGSSKSFLELQKAVALASGRPFGPFKPVAPGKVLYLALEDSDAELWRRIRSVVQVMGLSQSELEALPERLFAFSVVGKMEPLARLDKAGNPAPSGSYADLKALLGKIRPDLLVIDPKSRAYGLIENQNEHNVEWVRLLEMLIAEHPSMSILFVHHARKGTAESEMTADEMFRGGGGLVDAIRLGFGMRQMTVKDAESFGVDPAAFAELTTVKANYVQKWPGSRYFRREASGVLVPVDLNKDRLKSFAEVLVSALGQHEGPASRRDLAKSPSCKGIREALNGLMGFKKSIMDSIVDLALSEGWMEEVSISSGTTGQPKRVLKVVQAC